jgi:hypothetical protein
MKTARIERTSRHEGALATSARQALVALPKKKGQKNSKDEWQDEEERHMAVIDEIREEQGTAHEEQKHLAEQSRPAVRYLVQANLLAIRTSSNPSQKQRVTPPTANASKMAKSSHGSERHW